MMGHKPADSLRPPGTQEQMSSLIHACVGETNVYCTPITWQALCWSLPPQSSVLGVKLSWLG